MAYNEQLADNVRALITAHTSLQVEEKAMFGGLCFMVDDKMCIGVEKDRLMVRINPEGYDQYMTMEGCEPMNFTGKVMKGYVFVNADALGSEKRLKYWVKEALAFNAIAKASKKKRAATGSPMVPRITRKQK